MIPINRRQTCLKCGWKNPVIERSDFLVAYEKECPKCGGELEFKDVSQLDEVLDFFGKMFKNA